jgi:hypothetical protein
MPWMRLGAYGDLLHSKSAARLRRRRYIWDQRKDDEIECYFAALRNIQINKVILLLLVGVNVIPKIQHHGG